MDILNLIFLLIIFWVIYRYIYQNKNKNKNDRNHIVKDFYKISGYNPKLNSKQNISNFANKIGNGIETTFGYKISISKSNEPFTQRGPYKSDDEIYDRNEYGKLKYHSKVDNHGNRTCIKMDSIYGENGMDTSLYPKDTVYDKLVDIFTKKKNKYHGCSDLPGMEAYDEKMEDWERDIKMTFKLISIPLYIFNRESLPSTRYYQETDKDNTLLPLAQAATDILNEKANKTSIITDIRNIEVLTTEDQKQYTFDLYLNYPTVGKDNMPIFKNIKVKTILLRRRLLKDDIFAPNRYDSTKFVIKYMELIDSTNINTIPKIKKNEQDYYSFNKLMTESGDFTSDQYIDEEMIRNRKKHEHEMDFRNITIEDDNYLNDYMIPEKNCGI